VPSWNGAQLPIVVNTDQLAMCLGVCRKTINRWTIDGRIPSVTDERGKRRYVLRRVLKVLAGEQDEPEPEVEMATMEG
jgi:predicted site-specific integrase-resolvase